MSEQKQSTFVTVTGWLMAIISGFSVFIGCLQGVMWITFLGPMMERKPPQQLPPGFELHQFIFDHFGLMIGLILCWNLFVFVSSVGYIRREEWARKTMLGIWSLISVMMLAGIGFSFWLTGSMFPSDNAPPGFSSAFIIVQIVTAVTYLGFAVLFGLGAKKLTSPEVVVEFRSDMATEPPPSDVFV